MAKRATFPFINGQIIAVADTGDLPLTVSTIEAYVPEMNLVNVSTALHRLAKLSTNDPQAQVMLRQHPVLSGLLTAARGMLERARAGGTAPHCQALSNITWALATLQFSDLPLLGTVAQLSFDRIEHFKPFELSATLWAFAKLDVADTESAAALFCAAAEYIKAHVELFSFRCLVMISWAFATARQHDSSLFRGIASQMLPMVQTANCQELANAAWAFSTAGVRHERLFADLARKALQQLGDFKPQELSNMLWGFAASGFFHEEFFSSAARAAQFLELQAQQLANVLWALSRVRPRHRATHAAMLALLPRCTWMIESFKPQELASVLLAAAKCFGRGASGEALPTQVTEAFTAALPHILHHLRSFSGQSLANVASSYLSVQLGGDTELLPNIAREALARGAELESSALFLLLRNLPAARNNVCDSATRRLFQEAAGRVCMLQPKEQHVLSRICMGLLNLHRGGAGLSCEELQRCCQSLSQASSWTLTPLGDGDDTLLEALSAASASVGEPSSAGYPKGSSDPPMARAGGGQLPRHEAGHLLAGSNSNHHATAAALSQPRSSTDKESGSALAVRVPYSVKNTFLHVDDDEEPGSEDDDEDPAKHLPPSLGIIPDTVSPEKLAAYRANYQRFRAGKAVGAKGELCSSVTLVEALQVEVARHASGSYAPSEASSSSAAMTKLPPPLDFMPRYLSLEKLDAYRIDYQRFRAGNATGAKGEVSKRVDHDEAEVEVARLPPPLDIIPRDVSPRRLEAYRQSYQRFRAGNAVGAKGELLQAVTAPDEPHFIPLDKLATYCRADGNA